MALFQCWKSGACMGLTSQPRGTFRNYVNYMQKACFYLDQPVNWYTPALANVVKALRLVGKAKYRFPNFIDIELLTKIIKRDEKTPISITFVIFRFFSRCAFRPNLLLQ